MNSNEKILLLGSNGLLGSTLLPALRTRGYDLVTHSRSGSTDYHVDLTDSQATFAMLSAARPTVIINLAGLTNVDACEADPNDAYLANVRIVETISNWIMQSPSPCHLIHISTDQVYDGSGIHDESAVTLSNCYAFSKYAGELAASLVSSTILRTNFFGYSRCSGRVSLTDWLYNALSNRTPVQVFDDILFSPLSMETLTDILELIIRDKPAGVFNLGSHEGMSKADFAFAFADALDYPADTMTRTSTDKATFLDAYRPGDMRMDCTKLEHALCVKLPYLKDEITRVSEDYREA